MSRIRSVHPGLFTDEAFVALSAEAKIFFIGLWTEADDFGVFEWKPLTLKMRLLAGSTTSADPLLDELIEAGRIQRFENEFRAYGVIHNFLRYQRPRKPRSLYPLPRQFLAFAGRPIAENQSDNDDQVRTFAEPDSAEIRNRDSDGGERRGEEVEGRGKEESSHPHPESPRPRARASGARRASGDALDGDDVFDFAQEFDELWPLFPRKVDRGRAFAAFCETRRKTSLDDLRAGLERFAEAVAGKARKHVARPENWLKNQRWLDEPDGDQVAGAGPGEVASFAYLAESAEHWRDRCAVWFDRTRGGPLRSRWPDVWGPAPGERECRCPAEVLEEFGWSGESR